MSMRVLVVDDTAVFRRAVSDALGGLPGVEVVGTANNGRMALGRLAALHPDLMTLDIEMPEMNGIEVLEAMAADSPIGVIVLSALTVRGGEMTMRALELGAFDFVTKPDGGSREESLGLLRDRLAPILRAFQRRREIRSILGGKPAKPPQPAATVRDAVPPGTPASPGLPRRRGNPIVLIGVSTGGPNALAQVLPLLPARLAAPVFIVQHMPPLFTKALAATLQAKSAIRIKEAQDGEIAMAGCVYLAPGGRQMELVAGPQSEIVVHLTDDPPENNCRPSVDYLFRSAAQRFPGRAVAAILTGMGNDGARGMRDLKQTGCFSIAQDEASCVVFGMPKEAILAGVVDTVVPLNMIAATILRCVGEAHA
jgi:two-component system chemotaxis response regulator CheB